MNTAQDIATYAWRGDGKYILFLGSVLPVAYTLSAPALGGIVSLMVLGYLVALSFDIIQTTATGSDEAPDFPTITSLVDDVWTPLLQSTVAAIVAFAPAVVTSLYFGETATTSWLITGLWIGGSIYYPMALLAVAITGSLTSLSPTVILPSLFRAGWLYWAGILIFFLIKGVETLLGHLPLSPFIIGPVLAVFSLYVLMTNARILGLIYRRHSDDFQWL